MFTFIRITFFSFTIWLTAAFINGALFATVFSLGELIRDGFAESFGMATFFSLIFSAPAACCLWLVFLIDSRNEKLPVRLLGAAFLLSSLSCLLIKALPENVYNGHWVLLAFIIVLSSVLSVLLHHSLIRSFKKQQHV